MRYRLSAPLAALLLSLAASASAQNPPRDPAAAAALFHEGREAARRGDYAVACPKLTDSYRLDPAPGTALNLADCNEHLGKIASAWQLYLQAVEMLEPKDDRVAIARQRGAALERRIPRLTIALAPDAPPGARVLRDDAELGAASLGTALPIDPGDHVVIVKAPDREDSRFAVRLAEGESKRITVAPGRVREAPAPIAGPSAAVDVAPPRRNTAVRTAGFVVGGVGLVGLGTAIATGLVLPGKKKIVDANCDLDHVCNQAGFDAAQSGKTLAAANTAAWIAGGIATAAGVVLVVVGSLPGAPPRAAIRVTSTGASLGGSF
jgi:hypothetical protein